MHTNGLAGRLRRRVGIWIRVSTEDQARGESPEHHERRARSYAESKEWEVAEVYHLEGVSGKAVSDHPETKRMLADIKRGHIEALIFSKLARLARSTRDLLDFADYFKDHGADLVSLQESIDTSTPAGRLFYTMIAAMAQWEREEIADRVSASVPVRAKLGKRLGGSGPFGYHWVDGVLTPHPAEAPVRKLIYELFREHRRIKTVARLLNEAGYRTRRGADFSGTTVSRLIQDPSAKGLRRANYSRNIQNKRCEPKPESEWIHTPVEAIVPEELWDECNAILTAQRSNGKKPAKKPRHLFAGVTICHCGGKMYVPSNSPKYICQKCRNKIPVEDLEDIYFQQLKGFFLSPDEIAAFIQGADDTIRDKEALLSTLQGEQSKLREEMDRVYRLYIDGQLTSQGFGDRYKPLEDRVLKIENELPQLQADVDFLKINLLSSDEILFEAKDLYSRWPKLDTEEKRRIFENITEQITIGQESVTIHLCYLPVSSERMSNWEHSDMRTFPFCHIWLNACKPMAYAQTQDPDSLGACLRKRRMDLGLTQKALSLQFGVDLDTIANWELNQYEPGARQMAAVINFLGFNPLPLPKSFAEFVRQKRLELGLTQIELASILNLSPSTIGDWEHGRRIPSTTRERWLLTRLETLLEEGSCSECY